MSVKVHKVDIFKAPQLLLNFELVYFFFIVIETSLVKERPDWRGGVGRLRFGVWMEDMPMRNLISCFVILLYLLNILLLQSGICQKWDARSEMSKCAR